MIILEENFQWHLEAFASELFIYSLIVNVFKRVIELFWSKKNHVMKTKHK